MKNITYIHVFIHASFWRSPDVRLQISNIFSQITTPSLGLVKSFSNSDPLLEIGQANFNVFWT